MLVFTQVNQQETFKKDIIMRNLLRSEMKITASTFFSHMSDEDFILVAEAGQLMALCNALSLDLNSTSENEKYTA